MKYYFKVLSIGSFIFYLIRLAIYFFIGTEKIENIFYSLSLFFGFAILYYLADIRDKIK